MNAIHEYKQLLKNRGIRLCDVYGVSEFELGDIALEQADALAAVEILRKTSVPILGGDVYFRLRNGEIEFAYANWDSVSISGIPESEEERQHCANLSYLETEDYIKGFPMSDTTPLFVLVVSRDFL